MSPTLLEAAVAILLIVVAWQLGLAIAPIVLRELRALRQSLDDVSEDSLAETESPPEESEPTRKDLPYDPQ
ncbi:hypothetical protein K2Z83_01720 [Oscillochloris sp. ZM17-4]|uniref:hypothetical protein n=1 Tax=Oscillochloris sp. ZM17-4 TaxID=2866714 RepID=UPI001C73CCAB|nr:hypothetical protein [Oscillochloris sp. ZM17-4]MBX0326411.1 hypothetical protein [Oscillochloris sp. ZM17-4]